MSLTKSSTLPQVLEKFSSTAVYPQQHAAVYLTTGLMSEVGELANVVKKAVRGDYAIAEVADRVTSEYADICWYAMMRRGVYDGETTELWEVDGKAESYRDFLADVDSFGDAIGNNPVAMCVHLEDALTEMLEFARDPIDVAAELGVVISEVLKDDTSFSKACIAVAEKLEDRKSRGVIKGDGDNR